MKFVNTALLIILTIIIVLNSYVKNNKEIINDNRYLLLQIHAKLFGCTNEYYPYQYLKVNKTFTENEITYYKGNYLFLYRVDTLGGTKCWGVGSYQYDKNLVINYIESTNYNKCIILFKFKELP